MPLNYSKWDQLELSDDSDIEGHPNVDKRSLIRWKQRDIHEKRETRKHKISALRAELACDTLIAPRLRDIRATLADGGLKYFQQLVEKLQRNPSPDAPPTNAKDQPTYDAMVLSLLLQVWDTVKSLPADEQEPAILSGLDKHINQLADRKIELENDLVLEEKEQQKHITSEDIHEGFESKYTPAKPPPPPVTNAKIDQPKKTKTTKTTDFEVLNPPASSSKLSSPSLPLHTSPDSDETDTEELPELTPSLDRFSHLRLWDYEPSFRFIQAHRDVVVSGATDALLVAAFRSESEGRSEYAKQCVHQALSLQYCAKLGPDGVRLFYEKMMSGNQQAVTVFVKDVEDTYSHLKTRAQAAAAAEGSSEPHKEQIQLVPENPSASITFNVPDGPPPEDLRLEGPGTEDLDVEQVRQALQVRWDVFDSFPEDLKAALKVGTLNEVNKVLGSMDVTIAEEVVGKLDFAGIMSFVSGGVRDETGNVNVNEDDEDENPADNAE